MKRTVINLHTTVGRAAQDAAAVLRRHRERGSVTVEHIMWAAIVVALVTVVGGLLTGWATSKISELG